MWRSVSTVPSIWGLGVAPLSAQILFEIYAVAVWEVFYVFISRPVNDQGQTDGTGTGNPARQPRARSNFTRSRPRPGRPGILPAGAR